MKWLTRLRAPWTNRTVSRQRRKLALPHLDVFHQACKMGDLHQAQTLLREHPCLISLRDEEGFTALSLAIFENQTSIVRLLLPFCEAEILRPSRAATPLIHAISVDNISLDCVRLLLDFCDPKIQINTGHTALTAACAQGNVSLTTLLLPLSDVHAVTHRESAIGRHSQDALRLAALNGFDLCVEALLPHANPLAVDTKSRSALILAASNGHVKVVQQLLPVSDLAAKADCGTTALFAALCNGHVECVRCLLPHTDVLSPLYKDLTPLSACARVAEPQSLALVLQALRSIDRSLRESEIQTAISQFFPPRKDKKATIEQLSPEQLECLDLLFDELDWQQVSSFFDSISDFMPRQRARLERQALCADLSSAGDCLPTTLISTKTTPPPVSGRREARRL